jgi:hypothetical protein
MTIENLSERLTKMSDTWTKTEAEEPGQALPDGDYQAVVSRFDFTESKKDGNLLLITELTVTVPAEYAGRSATLFHDLENPERLGWTKAHLELLGITDVEPLTTLEARLQDGLDAVCNIVIKSKSKGDKTYSNIYINSVAKAGASTVDPTQVQGDNPPAPGDDDIPF